LSINQKFLITNIFFFSILSVVTIVTHAVVNRYEKSGPDLLTKQWTISPPEKIQTRRVNISENFMILFSGDSKTGINVHQDLSSIEHGTVLKFSADIKCDAVQQGKKPWNRARLLLVQNDGKKDRWDLSHAVASLAGTFDWENYHGFFTINTETEKTRVVAQLSQSIGSFELKNIQLYPVSETRVFTWVRNGILFSWGAFFLLLIGSCFIMGQETIIFRVLLASAFIAIIIGTTMPGEMRNQVSNEIKTRIDAENITTGQAKPWDLSKIAHFSFFALFGLILCLMMTEALVIHAMIIILILAGGTEMAQFFIDGRSPLFTDFFIDSVGGLFSIVLIRSISISNKK
jgi:hypothetical protein